MKPDSTSLSSSVLSGNRLALTRLLTKVENQSPEGLQAINQLFPYTGNAHLVGVTGAPGTGKSSLVNRLVLWFRNLAEQERKKVAVIAVDPTSPFSGGAILGDRVRMRDLAGDTGVFIRSMASRGALGGLSATTSGLVQVFDAAGFEIIFIETVGAGQGEVDIARLAHTTLVVEAPGMGDDIQAIKAGILEIADILVINKADRPGVENTERALRNMLQLAYPNNHQVGRASTRDGRGRENATNAGEEWMPPLFRTVATEGSGIDNVAMAINKHRQYLQAGDGWLQRERQRLQAELDSLILATLVNRWRMGVSEEHYQRLLTKIIDRTLTLHEAVKDLLEGSTK